MVSLGISGYSAPETQKKSTVKTNFEQDVADDQAKGGVAPFDGRRLTNFSMPSLPDLTQSSSPPPSLINSTNYDPAQQKIMDQLSARAEGDAGAGVASNLAAQKIRESSIGAQKEAAANRTMRGVSGTGADAFDQSKISAQTQRAIAGSTSDIASQAEQQKSSLLTAAGTMANARAATAQNAQQLALQQWQEQEADRRANQQAAIAQQQAQLQMLSNMMSLL